MNFTAFDKLKVCLCTGRASFRHGNKSKVQSPLPGIDKKYLLPYNFKVFMLMPKIQTREVADLIILALTIVVPRDP